MKEYDSVEFHEDIVIAEDVLLKGSSKALKNLETKSLTIKGNLEVGHELRCGEDLSVDGSIVVGKQIRANRIEIKGKVRADAIHGTSIAIKGKITVQQDLQAEESINLLLQPKKEDCIIHGRIVAPNIILEIGGSFTKWSLVGPRILKRLGKRSHFKKIFTITGLSIHGTKLILTSFYPPDRADFQFINCEINVEEIEKQQRLPPPVPKPPSRDDLRKTPA
jgi:cytoskeletal protein CcmA (bactofilin family)